MKEKVDFLIIGAMKSGTTTLYDMLRQHPDIYMPDQKELHFFSVYGRNPHEVPLEGARVRISRWEHYIKYFEFAAPEQVVGEASTSYLYTAQAAKNIKRFFPNVKLICVLRDPVQRAYSHYLWLRRIGLEDSPSFEVALEREITRIQSGSDFGRYIAIGRYYEQLKRYFATFSLDHMLVLLFDDLIADPVDVSQQVFRFLGVDPSFVPKVPEARNPSGIPRVYWLDNLLRKGSRFRRIFPKYVLSLAYKMRNLNLEKPPLSPQLQLQLANLYKDEVLKLQDLLNRDLSHWLEVQE